MNNSTIDTYEIKRKILNYTDKLTKSCGQVSRKFTSDMIYGILKSKNIILSKVSDELKEPINKKNTIERLSINLSNELDPSIDSEYCKLVNEAIGENPVILVDDSDVIKPCGYKFESLGKVRDGSSKEKKIEKGYMVTEMLALTKEKKNPLSLFSHIHSSEEKDYESTNSITYKGLDKVIKTINGKGTFVFDRGYDMNELFKYMYKNEQDFVIRLTEKRKLFHKGRWYKSSVLRDSRKGKIKTTVYFEKENCECYISHLNVKITADKRNVRLVLVYGLSDTPMMLVTNKVIKSKEDAISILRLYMSRWRIEEYFRFKKNEYNFEDFRVRNLKAINNLNKLLTYAIGFVGLMQEKHKKNKLANKMIKNAKGLRTDILFYYYQMSQGIKNTLAYARTGIKEWQKIERRPQYQQMLLPIAM